MTNLGADPKLDTAAAAAYIGCSPRTLEKRRQTGDGPAFLKLGRSVVYLRSDLDNWLKACRRVSTADQGPGRSIEWIPG